MTKRGKVLRDTNAGLGLLAVDGKQYPFSLEGMWRSDEAPKVGRVVDVTFDGGGLVEYVKVVTDNQVAKEQAEQALRKSGLFASKIKAKLGVPTIVAFAVLVIGWFFLSSVDMGKETVAVQITFWQLLGALSKFDAITSLNPAMFAHSGMGLYGLLALLSLAGPLLFYFWDDRRAALGGLLPLALMIVAAILVANGLHHAAHQASAVMSLFGESAEGKQLLEEATNAFMKQFKLGLGAYVSLAVSCYFAFVGMKRYLVAGA